MKKALLTLTIVTALCSHASAATRYWDRNGNTAGSGNLGGVWDTTSSNWNNTANGNGGTMAFANGDIAIFSAGTDSIGNITITGNATAGGLTIEEGTVEFTGNITLGANAINVSSGATLVTNDSARIITTSGSVITLNGGALRSTNSSAGSFVDSDSTITLSGGGIIDYTVANILSTIQSGTVISGSGGLTKNGVGVIAIASASTYTGGTTINGGELRIAGTNRLTTTESVTVNASGILNLNDNDQTISTLSGSGRVGLGSGTLTASSSSSSTFSGTIEDTANAGASGSTNTGGKLTKGGAGTLTLSGTSANTYTGLTTVNAGQIDLSKTAGVNAIGGGVTINGASAVVRLVNDNQIADSSVMTITSGTFNMNSKNETIGSLAGAGAITNMGILTLSGTASTTYSGNGSGTGSLVKSSTSTGTTTFSGTNSYSGGTTLNGGTLALGSSGALGTTGTISFGGGTLQFSGSNTTDYSARFSNAASQAYRLDTNGQSVTLATALTSSGGSLAKIGTGTLSLTGVNTYTAGSAVNAGTLQVTNASGSGTGSGNITVGTTGTGTTGTLNIGSGGTSGSVSGDISFVNTSNNSTVNFNRSDNVSYGGVISGGNGVVNKLGAGILTFTGNHSYTGLTTISAGTLAVGNGGTSGSLAGDITDNAALIVNRSDALTYSGAIGGTGTLTKQGAGVLTLSGANIYSGGTTLTAGTLALGSSGAIGTTGTIGFGGGTLQFSGSNTTDYSARFSNAASQAYSLDTNGQSVTLATGLTSSGGTLTKLGAGTLAMTGANTYGGTTTISAGTLSVGNGGTSGSISGAITDNAALIFNRSDAVTYSANISGTGTLTKQGAGVLTLSGANIYSGGTTLNGGTLALGSSGAIGTTGTISFGGGTLQFSGSNTTDYSARFSNAASQAYSLDTNGQSVSLATGLTSSGGTLTKLGAGTLTTAGANTYSGTTTISAGTLSVGSGGTSGSLAGDITDNSALVFNRSDDLTYAGAIGGTGTVTKQGAGTLTFTGTNNYSGGTTISGGTLQIGNAGTTGSISATGGVLNNGGLKFNRSNAITYSGSISGTGTLTQAGSDVLTLSGSNSYSGGTTLSAGTLALGSSGAIGTTGTISFTGGTMQFSGSNTTDYSARFSNAAGQAYSLDTNGQSVTLATGLTSSGGTLTKLGAGTLAMTGANTYTGTTTISAGTLSVGNGGTSGSISGAITDNAALVFNRSDSSTHSGNISGTGTLTKQGAGVLTLSGSNSYSGGTTLSVGTLALGSSGAIGTTGTISFTGGTMQFSGSNTTDYSARFSNAASQAYNLDTNGQNVTLASNLTSSGGTLTKLGAGTLAMTGANTYTGTTTISAGILSVGNGGTTGSISGPITDNAALVFNRSNSLTHSGNISGTGSLTKQGAGVLTLTGANTYGGGTTLSGGTLALGSSGAIGTTGTIDFSGGTLQFSGSNTTDYSARFSNAAGQAYSLDTNGQSVTAATALTSLGGTLTKLGAGTLTTTAANTYTGTTTISAGTLSVGNGGTSGSIAGDIADNAALDFNRSNNSSYSGQISGTGVVNKRGAGNLTLSGNNSHGGGTTQYDGGLKLGNKNALGTGTYTIGDATTSTTLRVSSTTNLTGANAVGNAVTVAKDFTVDSGSSDLELSGGVNLGAVNRTVTVDSSNLTKVSGVIGDGGSGTGALTKAGSGVLTLTGANTYGGGTTVSAGKLLVNNTTGSGTGSGNVLVAVGATLGGTGSITGDVTVNGTYSPGASIETMDTGALAFGAGSTFTYEINSNLAFAVAADLANAAGSLTINPTTVLSLTDFGSTKVAYGTKFTLISYSGSWVQPPGYPQPNHFAGLPNGASFTVGLNQWNIRYDDPNGGVNFGGGNFTNHVTISAVPEASTFLIIGLGGVFAFAAVRLGKRMGVNVLKV